MFVGVLVPVRFTLSGLQRHTQHLMFCQPATCLWVLVPVRFTLPGLHRHTLSA